jgi:WD40 repeat protein
MIAGTTFRQVESTAESTADAPRRRHLDREVSMRGLYMPRRCLVFLTIYIVAFFAPAVGLGAEPSRLDAHGDPLPPSAVARLGTVRWRQPWVFSLRYSTDGEVLASGGQDGRVRFWDPATGKELRRFDRRTEYLNGIALSANGRLVAAAGQDGVVRVWDAGTAKELHALRGHRQQSWCVAFSPDGKLLVSGGTDSTARVWDLGTGKEVRVFSGEQGHHVEAVAFSPDGKTLALGRTDTTLTAWEVGSWKRLSEFKGHGERINDLAYSPDGERLYSCSFDKTVRQWDARSGKELRRYGDDKALVRCMALSRDGKLLAAGLVDGNAFVWDSKTGKEVASWLADPRKECLASLAFSPDGKAIATASGSTIRIWQASTGKRLNSPDEDEGGVASLVFSPDGRRLAVGSRDQGSVRLYATTKWERLWRNTGLVAMPVALGFSPDGKALAVGDDSARLWEAETGKELRHWAVKGAWQGVAFSPDGQSLAVATLDGLALCDPVSGRERARLKNEQGGFSGLAFAPNGGLVASRGRESAVCLWEVPSGKPGRGLGKPDTHGQSMCFSADGRTVAASVGPEGDELALWETTSGEERQRIKVGVGQTLRVAFSPDGRTLATSGYAEAVCVWDAATGREVGQFNGHAGQVVALAFSPDGRLLASGGADTTALVWDAAGLVAKARKPRAKLSEKQLAKAVEEIGDADARRAYQATWDLTETPSQALPALGELVDKAPRADRKRLAALISDLDANDFGTREKASAELEKLGRLAEAALRQALKGNPSAEVTARLKTLLEKLDRQDALPQQRSLLRVVEVLERVKTAEARQLLERMANEVVDMRVQEEAKASLRRLARESANKP